MTTIDGTPGRWRPWLPGVAQAPAEALAAAEGCTVPELVAQLILDAAAKTDGGGAGTGNTPGPDADDLPPSAAAYDAPPVAATLPPACDTCGERSEHEVCS